MGINSHNRSFMSYSHSGITLEHLLDRAYKFISNAESNVVKYCKIRSGLCHHNMITISRLNIITNMLHNDDLELIPLVIDNFVSPEVSIKTLKNELKEIQSMINKLDSYMQTMVNYSYLM